MMRASTFPQRLSTFPRLLLLAVALLAMTVFLVADGVPPAQAQQTQAPPQNVAVTPGDGKLTLTWQAPSSWAHGTARYYNIFWKLSAAGDTEWTHVYEGGETAFLSITETETSFEFTGLQSGGHTVFNGISYDLRIQAESGVENTSSAWVEVTGTPEGPHTFSVLVSNISQVGADQSTTVGFSYAQGFTTGSEPLGYTLTSIEFKFAGVEANPGRFTPELWSATDTGAPDAKVESLTFPMTYSPGIQVATAPEGTTLQPNTKYFAVIVVGHSGTAPASEHQLQVKENAAAPTTIGPGWGLDARRYSRWLQGSWHEVAVGFDPETMLISVKGAVSLAPGDLDPTFDTDGKVTTPIGSATDRAYAMAIQSADGKIVAAGESESGTVQTPNNDFAVARYTAVGALDTTFSSDGKVTTAIGADDEATAVAIQSDGKILAAGESTDNFAVVRYTTAGVLDTGFSTDGKVTTDIGTTSDDAANAVAIQSDGKILVAGTSSNDFAVVRYTTAGVLDTTFSTDGKVTTDIGTTSVDVASAVAIQSDGKIVVAGQVGDIVDGGEFAVVRYNTDGSLDTTFGGDGKVTTGFTTRLDAINAVDIRSDGKIVVAGSSNVSLNTSPDFAVAVYRADGTLDTTFSGDGKVTTDFGSGDHAAYAVAWQSDGNIVAAGESNSDFALARYVGPLSGNANLSALTVNGSTDGTTYTALTGANAVLPAFDAGTTAYRATVGNDVTHVQLVVPPAVSGSTVTAGKSGGTLTAVHNSSRSMDLPLDLGDNEFTVRVTALEGSTRDYTVTVRRVPQGTEWHATLEVQYLSSASEWYGCDSPSTLATHKCSTTTTLTEDEFTVGDESYSVDSVVDFNQGEFGEKGRFFSVNGDVDSDYRALNYCVGSEAFALSGVNNQGFASWSSSANWSSGDLVSLSVGSSCQPEPLNLSNLRVAGSTDGRRFRTLTGANAVLPAFDAGTTSYRATVANDVTRVLFAVPPAASGSTVTVGPSGGTLAPVFFDSQTIELPLDEGDHEFTVRVTAQDGTTKDYTVAVRKVPSGTVWHATLDVQFLTTTSKSDGCDNRQTLATQKCTTTTTLTEDEFTVGDESYSVQYIIDEHDNARFFGVSGDVDSDYQALNYCVGSEAFTLSDVDTSGNEKGLESWSGSSNWSPGDLVSLSVGASCQPEPLNLSSLTVRGSTDGTTYTALSGANAVLPAFDAGTTSYRATVGNDVTIVDLTSTLAETSSTFVVTQPSTGQRSVPISGQASGDFALDLGENELVVRVTAQDGTTRDYTVAVRRVPEGTAWHATLEVQDIPVDGCDNTDSSNSNKCSTATTLTEDAFTVGDENYTIDQIQHVSSLLTFIVNGDVDSDFQALNFCVGSEEFALSAVPSSGAQKGIGTWSASLDWSAGDLVSLSIGASCQAVPPDAPTDLEAASAVHGLWLTWTAPTGSVQSYDVHYKLATATDQAATTANDPSTGWVDAGHTGTDASMGIPNLAQDTAHHVRVRAVNSIGNGDWVQAQGTPGGAATVGFQRTAYETRVSSGMSGILLLPSPSLRCCWRTAASRWSISWTTRSTPQIRPAAVTATSFPGD